MKFVSDLHIHSKFSRATSRDMTLDSLAYWAKIKGISLLATGDFTHPEWLFLCKEKLKPEGNGFFRLKQVLPVGNERLTAISVQPEDVAFVLTAEISFIYSKKGKVRKIHLLLLAPDFETVDMINSKLIGIGNLSSDGRPILGMDVKDFVKMVADHAPRCVVIPAHIWTPWFSLFGANSGFDSIEECFEEITPFIFALETGLSSDPSMNWRWSELDRYALVSNSDAHSPSKIGREGNVFDVDFNFQSMMDAIKKRDPDRFLYTIEFFPEEGKYHFDGHRKCKVVLSPQDTISQNSICPVCGKKLTIGVMHRIEELCDQDSERDDHMRIPYKNFIPLNEIIGQALEKSSDCKSVWDAYFRFIKAFENEHSILSDVPISELQKITPDRVGLGVERMRKGLLKILPGHDGSFGKISLFDEDLESPQEKSQLNLF